MWRKKGTLKKGRRGNDVRERRRKEKDGWMKRDE